MAVLMIGLTSGCALFRNPFGDWTKATTKVEAVQKKIDKNEDANVAAAKTYVYATGLALQADPSTNRFHTVETDLNSKAQVVLGPPTMEEVIYLQEMVKNLLHTNKSIILKGENQLADLDEAVVNLQEENEKLKNDLTTSQEKLVSVGLINTGYAAKWTSLVKIFWWGVYLVIAVFAIKILSAVLPPPYNTIVSIVAVPIGLVIKGIQGLFPEAKKAAGVVAASTYDNTKLALSHIVEALEDAKAKDPTIVQALSPYLKETTSKEVTRPIITDVKRELGYV